MRVAEAITRTVGEIIAERALGVLGESMTRQLLQQQLASSIESKPQSAGDPRRIAANNSTPAFAWVAPTRDQPATDQPWLSADFAAESATRPVTPARHKSTANQCRLSAD